MIRQYRNGRGLGCPDLSLLSDLSCILGVDIEKLLSGELDVNHILGGNMKHIHFYICPTCDNLVTTMIETAVSCCGKKLEPIELKKAAEDERLSVDLIENDYFITSEHEMTREHHISFIALLTGDTIMLRRQYPE